MFKVRTAKKTFSDSFGNQVQSGERFGIIEVRPLFVSRKALEEALEGLTKESKSEESSSEGGQ